MELSECAALLSPDPLPLEMGVERLPSGQLHVAARTDMHGCSGRMFEWWFAWGPGTREYVWWHPGDHVSSEWLDLRGGSVVGATHVVDERLGGDEVLSLRIRFHDPSELFGAERLAEARARGEISAAVCAYIGLGAEPPRDAQGRPLGGRLVHVARDTSFGCVLRSNFWLGWGLPLSPEELAREIPDEMGLRLMKHAYTEFHMLSRFLPSLYVAERRDAEPPPLPW
jgi:hypothetical protein